MSRTSRGMGAILSRREFVRLSGAGLAGATLYSVVGCGGEETIGGGQGTAGGTFVFGQGVDAVSLDPINQADDTSSDVASHIFSTLLQYPRVGTELVPALATEVPEPENGGRAYTFRLREGVRFHDGAPFDAQAVKFNFDRWRDSNNPYHKGGGAASSDFSLYALLFGGFDEESVIEAVEVTDEHTVHVGLREPLGPFLNNLAQVAFSIASPKAIREDVENFWKGPVGTGPFKFVSWTRGSRINLEKDPDWWGKDVPESQGGGGPHLDRVVFESIPDNTSRVAALTGGELSGAIGLVPDDLPSIEQNPDLTVAFRPPLTSGHIGINIQKEPFGDVRVRKAVAHAVNVPQIVDAFFGRTGEIATSPMPSGLSFFNENIEPYRYDPAESERLLEEAGLAGGFDTTLWYIPIPRPYVPDGKGIAQAVQSDLHKVGIKAELVTYEFATYLEKVGMGEHDMALYGGTESGTDPDFRLYYWFSSAAATEANASNISYYKNSEVDRLIAQARATLDQKERRDLYHRVQEIVHEDVAVLPLAYVNDPVGLQKRVKGYQTTLGGDRFNTVKLSGGA